MEDRDVTILTSEHSIKYEFDFDKIKTVEDVIRILKALRISFGEKYPAFEEVKDLLKEVK
jgi:hypothetical protein